MILVSEIDSIMSWVDENRPDQESEKPYCIPVEVDGGYELPNDDLIKTGLVELGIPFNVIVIVDGVSFKIPSNEL